MSCKKECIFCSLPTCGCKPTAFSRGSWRRWLKFDVEVGPEVDIDAYPESFGREFDVVEEQVCLVLVVAMER